MEIPDHNKVRPADTSRLCFSQECRAPCRLLQEAQGSRPRDRQDAGRDTADIGNRNKPSGLTR